MSSFEKKTLFIGCGNMGSVILCKMIDSFALNPNNVVIIDKISQKNNPKFNGAEIFSDFNQIPSSYNFEYVFFNVKPQDIEQVLKNLKLAKFNFLDAVFISIIAGKKISFFQGFLGNSVKIARTMPNLAIEYSSGIMPYMVSKNFDRDDILKLEKLFSDFGIVFQINDEAQFDPLTAIFGSGPAIIFLLQEIISDIANKYGFEKSLIDELAKNLFLGSALMSKNSKKSFSLLRENVTSKKGVTESLISNLNKDNSLKNIFDYAIREAIDRSRQLS